MSSLLDAKKPRRSTWSVILGHVLAGVTVVSISVAVILLLGIYAKVAWRVLEFGWRLLP